MALIHLLEPLPVLVAVTVALISFILYRIFYHPLSHIPGPLIAKTTSLWLYRITYQGIESSVIDRLHKRYGQVVRVAPNEVSIADGAAISHIYVKNGGLLKSTCYSNYDIDGYPTIFSTVDPNHRAVRSKAVVSMFAPAAIREGAHVVRACIQTSLARLKREMSEAKGTPIDILNIMRSLALDAVTAYLFHEPYNGGMEKKLSASPYVDLLVETGKVFYLPKWAFSLFEMWTNRSIEKDADVLASLEKVDDYTSALVDRAMADEASNTQTYQARLLNAGCTRVETIGQCKDLMFAGTDSAGMNLASVLWHLASNKEM